MRPNLPSGTRVLGLTLIAVFLAAVAYGGDALKQLREKAEVPSSISQENTGTSSPMNRDTAIAGESITLTPRGFEPGEIVRAPGRFVLNINNRSGLHELNFRLTGEQGATLREVGFARGRLSSRQFLNLPVGRYRLTELRHPRWVCEIVIAER